MSEYFDRDLAVLDHIEDLLGAYGEQRLSPSAPALSRMRTHVLREASLQAAAATARERHAVSHLARARWALPGIRIPQRAAVLGLAAALTFGTSAAVLAAPPGSPFFNARIAIEIAFLPAQVDQRLASHESHLDERLVEAQLAAARGDYVALAAALEAYRAEVDASVADVGDDADRLAHLEAELAKHTATLEALAVKVPDQGAIEHAIDTSQKATTKLQDQGTRGGPKPSSPPGKPDAQKGR
jgi:hypothetical protein